MSGYVALVRPLSPRLALEQPQPVLELRNAELQLVEVVTGDEVQLVDDGTHRPECLLRHARLPAAQPRGQLDEQLLEDVCDAVATAPGHEASCVGAAGASRGGPAHPDP